MNTFILICGGKPERWETGAARDVCPAPQHRRYEDFRAAFEFGRSLKALRGLFTFPRVQFRQEPARGFSVIFRLLVSASAFHEQKHNFGATHEGGSFIRERGFFSQAPRGGERA